MGWLMGYPVYPAADRLVSVASGGTMHANMIAVNQDQPPSSPNLRGSKVANLRPTTSQCQLATVHSCRRQDQPDRVTAFRSARFGMELLLDLACPPILR